MDHRVGEFLCSAYSAYASYPSKPSHPSEAFDTYDTQHALFIAESRPSYWLPRVIANFRHHHPTWPVYLLGTPDVFRLVLTTLGPDGILPLPFPAPTSATEYSHLMTSPHLWNSIKHDHVLVFQLDTVCLRPVPTDVYDDYAMVGAVCGHVVLPGEEIPPPQYPKNPNMPWTFDTFDTFNTFEPPTNTTDAAETWTIQGGLSYRNVHAMRRASHAMRPDERHLAEDIAFTRVLRRLDETLPTLHTCLEFAIEAFGNPRTAIGMHGVDKLYVPAPLIAATLPPPPTKRPLFHIIRVPRIPPRAHSDRPGFHSDPSQLPRDRPGFQSDPATMLWLRCMLLERLVDHFFIEGIDINPLPELADFTNITWIPHGHPHLAPDLSNLPDAVVLVSDILDIPDPAVLLDTLPYVQSPITFGQGLLAPVDHIHENPTADLPDASLDLNHRWVTALLAIQKNIQSS